MIRGSSSGRLSKPCSGHGIATEPGSIASTKGSRTTSEPRSPCRRWSSETSVPTLAQACCSRATRRPGNRRSTVTSSSALRAKTLWLARTRLRTLPCSMSGCRRLPKSYGRLPTLSSAASPTSVISSSPSSAAGCGCSRFGRANAARKRRCVSRWTWLKPLTSPCRGSRRFVASPSTCFTRPWRGLGKPRIGRRWPEGCPRRLASPVARSLPRPPTPSPLPTLVDR